MDIIKDDVIGILKYDGRNKFRDIEITLFGKEYTVSLNIRGNKNTSIHPYQYMAYKELFIVASFCFALLVLLSSFSPIFQNGFEEIYSLLGRRTMMVSAVNKFKYYDFFSDNPKMGLAGIFPRWLIPISNPYEGETIGKIIADIYYNKPEMNSNTGFLAEGYMRFGYIGIFVGLGIYAAILRLLDRMQIRAGYGLTVSIFIYPVFTLTDAHLMDSLILGPWMILLIIAILYRTSDIKKYSISANKIKNDRVFERYEIYC